MTTLPVKCHTGAVRLAAPVVLQYLPVELGRQWRKTVEAELPCKTSWHQVYD